MFNKVYDFIAYVENLTEDELYKYRSDLDFTLVLEEEALDPDMERIDQLVNEINRVDKALKRYRPSVWKYIKCFFGFHEWDRQRSSYNFRECVICGRQEIREPTCPDGLLDKWHKNY